MRNALFLSAGISKMNFVKFAVVDLLACTTTSVILFSLGRLFAENYEKLFEHLATQMDHCGYRFDDFGNNRIFKNARA